MSERAKKIMVVAGAFILLVIIIAKTDLRTPETSQAPESTPCSEAAKVITLMMAKDGYHVTVPKPTAEGMVEIGSTDMNEHTVEEVKGAMNLDHDLVMQLRAAGCKRIGFYGDKLGTFGSNIDLDDLP